MDELARKLRRDAGRIDATVSEQLDRRIRASLENVTPEPPPGRPQRPRPAMFWWASSLTGLAAAMVLIVVVNLGTPDPVPAPARVARPLVVPQIEWRARAAVLTSPLEQEMEDLQADLKKAEEAVRQDIDELF